MLLLALSHSDNALRARDILVDQNILVDAA